MITRVRRSFLLNRGDTPLPGKHPHRQSDQPRFQREIEESELMRAIGAHIALCRDDLGQVCKKLPLERLGRLESWRTLEHHEICALQDQRRDPRHGDGLVNA